MLTWCSKDEHTKCYEKDKSASYDNFQQFITFSTFAMIVRESRWSATCKKTTPPCKAFRDEQFDIKIPPSDKYAQRYDDHEMHIW